MNQRYLSRSLRSFAVNTHSFNMQVRTDPRILKYEDCLSGIAARDAGTPLRCSDVRTDTFSPMLPVLYSGSHETHFRGHTDF